MPTELAAHDLLVCEHLAARDQGAEAAPTRLLAALTFWQAATAHARISAPFRAVCDAKATALARAMDLA